MSAPAKQSMPALDRARGVAERAREEVEALVEGFKAKSRYFQWKVYIVAAYVALLTVTLVVALWDTNELGAEVRLRDQPGLGGGVAIAVTNLSDENWTDVSFILDGTWRSKKSVATVNPGGRVLMLLSEFERLGAELKEAKQKNDKSNQPPSSLVPRTIRIEASEGTVELELQKE